MIISIRDEMLIMDSALSVGKRSVSSALSGNYRLGESLFNAQVGRVRDKNWHKCVKMS